MSQFENLHFMNFKIVKKAKKFSQNNLLHFQTIKVLYVS